MLYIRLDGSKAERDLFLSLLPIVKDIKELGDDHLIGVVDFEEASMLAHRASKYDVQDKNNQTNKAIALKKIRQFRAKGLSFQKIADELNRQRYKTSRGKFFSSMQVKRILDEAK